MSGVRVAVAWAGVWPVVAALPGETWDAQAVVIEVARKPPFGATGAVAAHFGADGALTPDDAIDGASAAFDAALAAAGWLADDTAEVFATVALHDRAETAAQADEALALAARVAQAGLTADAAGGRAVWRTSDGDVADAIARAVYGAEDGGAAERLIDANPGLASIGPVLPAGLFLALPPPPATAVRRVTRLWS